MAGVYTKKDLIAWEPVRETFVGIDSDGCVFDTMEVKQKNHFHPLIIRLWGLEAIEREVRQAAEFANLYSAWRGKNRFLALLKMFELLEAWPAVRQTGVALPDLASLRAYCGSGLPLGNPSLRREVERTGDAELERVLAWSLAVNRDIDAHMEEVPPFAWAVRSLARIAERSDAIVVSQTPEEALVKEWRQHGIDGYIRMIAGQELGTKAEHLQMAAGGKYAPDRILMIGDAPGDLAAAEAVGAWFYPIHPGDEEASWQRFCEEAYDLFLAGEWTVALQRQWIDDFMRRLPSTPPWAS